MAYFRNVELDREDFDSAEDYDRALLEQERIDKINNSADITDPVVARTLIDGFTEHPDMFRTIVGTEFLEVLRKNSEGVPPMPIPQEPEQEPEQEQEAEQEASEAVEEEITEAIAEEPEPEESEAVEENAIAEENMAEPLEENAKEDTAELVEETKSEDDDSVEDNGSSEIENEPEIKTEQQSDEADEDDESEAQRVLYEQFGTQDSFDSENVVTLEDDRDLDDEDEKSDQPEEQSEDFDDIKEEKEIPAAITHESEKIENERAAKSTRSQSVLGNVRVLLVLFPFISLAFPMAGAILSVVFFALAFIMMWIHYAKSGIKLSTAIASLLCVVIYPVGVLLTLFGLMKKVKYVVWHYRLFLYSLVFYLLPIVLYCNLYVLLPDASICIYPMLSEIFLSMGLIGRIAIITDFVVVVIVMGLAIHRYVRRVLHLIHINVEKGVNEENAAAMFFEMPAVFLCMFKPLIDQNALYEDKM